MFDIEDLKKFKDIGLDVTLYDDKNTDDVVMETIECRFKKIILLNRM